MKQYTTPDQTTKLMELGFEKPKGWNAENISSRFIMAVDIDGDNEFNYSIGELIEMLPKELSLPPYYPPIFIRYEGAWNVLYGEQEDYTWEWSIWYEKKRKELIDALYDMVVKLKEEGVI